MTGWFVFLTGPSTTLAVRRVFSILLITVFAFLIAPVSATPVMSGTASLRDRILFLNEFATGSDPSLAIISVEKCWMDQCEGSFGGEALGMVEIGRLRAVVQAFAETGTFNVVDAVTHVGWSEMVTIHTGTPGERGEWIFTFHVSGS